MLAEFGTRRIVQVDGRGTLDDLLVAALHGAVALVEVHEVAVAVTEDLHLDVPRAAHQLLEIDLVVAERGLGFAPRDRQQFGKLAPLSSTTRMPRPPPPRLAFSMTG